MTSDSHPVVKDRFILGVGWNRVSLRLPELCFFLILQLQQSLQKFKHLGVYRQQNAKRRQIFIDIKKRR